MSYQSSKKHSLSSDPFYLWKDLETGTVGHVSYSFLFTLMEYIEEKEGGTYSGDDIFFGNGVVSDVDTPTSYLQLAFNHATDFWTYFANVSFSEYNGDIEEFTGLVVNEAQNVVVDGQPLNGFFKEYGEIDSLRINDGMFFLRASFSSGDFNQGGLGYNTILHELGHVFGLDDPGVGPLSIYDSIMVYSGTAATGSGLMRTDNVLTPLVYDIAWMQASYGINTTYNSGNTTYSFNAAGTELNMSNSGGSSSHSFTSISKGSTSGVYMAIWDAGNSSGAGDVIDASAYTGGGVRISLQEGSEYKSVIGDMNIFIAFGADIENAIGSAGDDAIYGNNEREAYTAGEASYAAFNGNNKLDGGLGNDKIYGMGGDDTLIGGEDDDQLFGGDGADEYHFYGDTYGDDLIVDTGASDRLHFEVSSVLTEFSGTATLVDPMVDNVYELSGFSGFTITLIGLPHFGGQLLITNGLNATAVANWTNGKYGIFLENAPEPEETLAQIYDTPVNEALDPFIEWRKNKFYSPLLVDLDGGGTKDGLVSAENGVFFDVDGDGFAERIGWTGDDNAIVVRDLNDNGVIDSQLETFYTDNTHDAFAMLAEYDATVNGGNNDGKFTSLDGGWSEIQLWKDTDGDGVTDSGELFAPEALGVYGFGLTESYYKVSNANGNSIDGRGSWLDSSGNAAGYYEDVFFDTNQEDSWYVGDDLTELPDVSLEALQMPLSRGYGNLKALHYALTENEDLMEMMEEFVDLDLSTDSSQINALAQAIIIEWAGASDVDFKEHHPNFDSRLIEVFAKIADVDPGIIQEYGNWRPYLRWSPIFNEIKARLLVQGPMQEIFAGSYYDFSTDSLVLEGALEDILDRAALLAPVDNVEARAYWSDVGLILIDRAGQFSLSQGDMKDEVDVAAGFEVTVFEGYVEVFDDTAKGYNYQYKNAMFVGDSEAQYLVGHSANDLFLAGDGADTILSGGGNDSVEAGNGNKRIQMDGGSVFISAGDGNNRIITTGSGDDTVSSGNGNSHITVGSGSDSVSAGNGNNKIEGNGGNDTITAGNGLNTITGGDGADSITAGNGGNNITAGAGNDTVSTGSGADTIDGGAGTDSLSAGGGNDLVYGRDGADTLTGGAGNDTLRGGAGNDTYVWAAGDGNDTIEEYSTSGDAADVIRMTGGITAGDLDIYGGAGGTLVIKYTPTGETITIAKQYLGANNQVETILFDNATTVDLLQAWDWKGSDGNDSLSGTAYNDTISGGRGDDYLRGGGGDDTYIYHNGDGSDRITDTAGDNTLILNGFTAADFSISSSGASYRMLLNGTSHSVLIQSYDALDWTVSYQSVSSVSGGSSADTLYDTAGATTLSGGSGADTFVFLRRDNTTDRITDFSLGSDIIDLRATNFTVTQFSHLTITNDSGDAIVDLGNNQKIRLVGVTHSSVTGASFLFNTSSYSTSTGTAGADTINGGSGDDDIDAGEGNNLVDAGNGNNVIKAGAGNDTITGGTGNDLIYAGDGTNVITAGSGNNTVYSGTGNDSITASGLLTIYAGDGDDTVTVNSTASSGNSLIDLGAGQNVLAHSAGGTTYVSSAYMTITTGDLGDAVTFTRSHATVYGGAGADTITTGNGDDLIEGGAGADVISGGTGSNTLDGGDGNDAISAGNSTNLIYGGTGNDSITASGLLTIYAGDGDDTVTVNSTASSGNSLIDLGAGQNVLAHSAGGTTYVSSAYMTITTGDLGDAVTFTRSHATVYGGAGADTITTGSGDDLIEGGAGADIIDGSTGSNTLDGGDGNDSISAGNSTNLIYGGTGNDSITASGLLTIYAGDGDDTVTVNSTASSGNSLIDLGAGQNVLAHSAGGTTYVSSAYMTITTGDLGDAVTFTRSHATVYGGAGADTITTGSGDDLIEGGAGADVISGGTGSNTLDGGDGNDAISAGNSTNLIYGGNGNDSITASGLLTIYAGDGDDTVTVNSSISNGNALIDLGAGQNVLANSAGGVTFNSSAYMTITTGDLGDAVTYTRSHATVYGGAGADTITTGSGNDLIEGGVGADVINGDTGSNTLDGGDGNDSISAGSGNDSIYGGDGADTISGGGGTDMLNGGDGNDSITGGTGADLIYGGDGNDTVNAGNGANTVYGGAGTDHITGGTGVDILYGEAGNDTLLGGNGNDTLYGGAGVDSMTGGSNNDTFVFTSLTHSTDSARDIITDFVHGTDKIDLTGLGFTAITSGSGSGATLGFSVVGGNTIIVDDDSDFSIQLTGSISLTGSDFIF